MDTNRLVYESMTLGDTCECPSTGAFTTRSSVPGRITSNPVEPPPGRVHHLRLGFGGHPEDHLTDTAEAGRHPPRLGCSLVDAHEVVVGPNDVCGASFHVWGVLTEASRQQVRPNKPELRASRPQGLTHNPRGWANVSVATPAALQTNLFRGCVMVQLIADSSITTQTCTHRN